MTQPNIILTDHAERDHLLPLTFTRPVGLLRIGMWTIAEKWQRHTGANVSYKTQDYLSKVFQEITTADNFYVNGALIPTAEVMAEILDLAEGTSLFKDEQWLATRSATALDRVESNARVASMSEVRIISRSWKIFQWNGWAMEHDFAEFKKTTEHSGIPAGVICTGDNIIIEKGAVVRPGTIINAETGPIYIASGAEVMEGAIIRGGLALMEGAILKMGAKIYGPTTIGPHCRVGGEVNNSILFGYSNKGHDGFIGNTVIGEWCNLGADTNTSNLKNNYADVKIHNYALNRSESTGGQFCGLTMGDHAKSGINTMFNTGTVCGIFANVFGSGFPHRRIPDFGWGGAEGFKTFRLPDALEVANRMMERRKVPLTDELREMYAHLFDHLTAPL